MYFQAFCSRKALQFLLFATLTCHTSSAQNTAHAASEPGGTQSLGFSTSFSPNSSHILIGDSERRRVWTLGAEYTRRLFSSSKFRLDYQVSLLPLYEETDPTLLGTIVTIKDQVIITPQTPVRVVQVARGPVGSLSELGVTAPIYALFGRQDTYAALIAPAGARISAFPRSRIEPTFSMDLGFVISARDIPVDGTDQFNYMFSFGPGVQFFTAPNASLRVEYIYRHVSNAHQGIQNPGVDQGVFRLTLSHHR